MSCSQVFEREIEGRMVLATISSKGEYNIVLPNGTDGLPEADVQSSTRRSIQQDPARDIRADSLGELRQKLLTYQFSEGAADEIIAGFEGY